MKCLLVVMLCVWSIVLLQTNAGSGGKFKELLTAPLTRDIHKVLSLPKSSGRHRRDTCGAPTTLTAAQQVEAVAAHNVLRAKELAANELKMTWNANLAARAQQWTNQCQWAHGMLTDCAGDGIGQNLFMTGGGSQYPAPNMTYAALAWASERSNWDFNTGTCAAGKVCGHWTQVIWAESAEIGCGYTQCPSVTVAPGNVWTNAIIIACDYNPPGNVVGEQLFEAGTPCSACLDVTHKLYDNRGYKCQDKLCVPCVPRTDSTCQCGTPQTCQNGGTWSSLDCVCQCPATFYGVLCEHSCTCEDQYPDECATWLEYCTIDGYYDFMQSTCPKTCNLCNLPASC